MRRKFHKAGFIAVFILLFFTDTIGKNSERMVNIYDTAVCVVNPDSQLYKASVGCVNQLVLNSTGNPTIANPETSRSESQIFTNICSILRAFSPSQQVEAT